MTQLNPERVEKVRNYGLHVLSYDDRSAFLIALCEHYLAALRGEPVATDTQNARFAIDGAIAFGMRDINKPSEGHWLMEYWEIGRKLAAPQPSPAEAVRKGLRLAENQQQDEIFSAINELLKLPDAELLERAGGV